MFKSVSKADDTKRQIFETALRLFRTEGFDETTMRQIAGEASVALGATYYYFSNKEAIVAEYYDWVQEEHARQSREVFARTLDFKLRLAGSLKAKLSILKDDRKLLTALFRYGGDPDHPLSWFGPQTAGHRRLCMQVFAEAVAPLGFPKDLERLAPVLLWALHMGLLLYFLYDDSPGQKRTHALTDASVSLSAQARKLITLPFFRPFRRRLIVILEDAGLIPNDEMALPGESHIKELTS